MGKSRKTTNNKANKQQCYVLLSRKLGDGGVEPTNTEVIEEQSDGDTIDVRESTPTISISSFDRIRDATMESNELIKEIIFNVRMLRKELAEMTKHVRNGGSCSLKE